jgi:hypothetical protein
LASDKIDHQGVGAIAQAMKHQARTGAGWDDLSAAAKESIDQILSSIARTVSTGQGAHWDGIMAYAEAAKPVPAAEQALKTDRSFDYPYTTPSIIEPRRVGLSAIERSIRAGAGLEDNA